MKKQHRDSLLTMAILFVIILACKMVTGPPWWSFIVPLLFLGFVITRRKWEVPVFSTGFITGFLIWAGGNLYFHLTLHGTLLQKFGTFPALLLLLVAGLAGGLLTGLSLYTGHLLAREKMARLSL